MADRSDVKLILSYALANLVTGTFSCIMLYL